MNKTIAKLIAILTCVSAFASYAPCVTADGAPSDELLAEITFDESGKGGGSFAPSIGGTVTEHGSIRYTKSFEGNDALTIPSNGADNYLELPKGILNGKDAATFSFMLKPSSGWAFMTTPLAGAQEYLNEKYIGMLSAPASITAERYNNSGARLSSVSSSGSFSNWQHVSAVFEENGTKLYINGELAASDSAAVDIASLFTADASTWIGHGNWGEGEGFSGSVDNFRIYGKALSGEEIKALADEADEYVRKAVIYEKNSITAETHFFSSDKEVFSVDGISGDLTIKTEIKNYTALDADITVTAGTAQKAVSVASGSEDEVVITMPCPDEEMCVSMTYSGKTSEIARIYAGVTSPVAAKADSASTTEGVHDPSIVKFPNDDTYYVYSSHHLIFTSKDLINWEKHDFTSINAATISPNTQRFINDNYTNTKMNDTFWAPDVIYREGDAHPYWMYISLSCGLGGRNSAIALEKSTSPLFWADEDAEIVDAGIVFATKEASGYKTNSIDANIYTDTNDNKQYFIWGSFWGGIQSAPLTSEGLVEGIDYTSDETILKSCANNFGTSVFTQKNGVAGPEGAWMIERDGFRYMFTSYGWLGSNYNTRVARSKIADNAFNKTNGWNLTDANGVTMYDQQSKGSLSKTTGYKLIGSYRLGEGSREIEIVPTADNKSDNYSVKSGEGDAMVYYGPGHNSAINVGNDMYYVSHTRKNAVEIAATLQVRKILWTEDGWPVVSPVTYAGEIEQAIPKDMIAGTYDLASVGQTKMDGNEITSTGALVNRNYDLPVLSSKVTLNADGTMTDAEGGELGTWEFDGDHKVTLKFTKDGDASNNKDEFYKNGDVMTLYALFGYDKDERSAVVALTGTDQNHVTQFAKKLFSSTLRTDVQNGSPSQSE